MFHQYAAGGASTFTDIWLDVLHVCGGLSLTRKVHKLVKLTEKLHHFIKTARLGHAKFLQGLENSSTPFCPSPHSNPSLLFSTPLHIFCHSNVASRQPFIVLHSLSMPIQIKDGFSRPPVIFHPVLPRPHIHRQAHYPQTGRHVLLWRW